MIHLKTSLLVIIILSAASSGILSARIPDKQTYLRLKKTAEEALLMKLDMKIGEHQIWQFDHKISSVKMTGKRIIKPEEDPVSRVYASMEKEGWTSDFSYSADGPDGTVFSYIKNGVVCIFDINWSPGHIDGLTKEEEEELEKEPVTYEVTIYCFMK